MQNYHGKTQYLHCSFDKTCGFNIGTDIPFMTSALGLHQAQIIPIKGSKSNLIVSGRWITIVHCVTLMSKEIKVSILAVVYEKFFTVLLP